MAKTPKGWKKVRGKRLWENSSKSRSAQRHIIIKIGVSPMGTEGHWLVFKEIDDEKYLTPNYMRSH